MYLSFSVKTSYCLPHFTSIPSPLPLSLYFHHFISLLIFSHLSQTVCASPFRCLPPLYGTTKAAQCGVWLVESPPRGGDAFCLLGSHASWQNRACKVRAASRSHPSSFFVHLHLNSARLWMPKQLTSQQRAERGVALRRTTGFWSARYRRLV